MRKIVLVLPVFLVLALALFTIACAQPAPAPAPAPKPAPAPTPAPSPVPAPAATPAPAPKLPDRFIFAASGAGKAFALSAFLSEMSTKYTPMKGATEKVTGSVEAIKGVASGTYQSAVYSAASASSATNDDKSKLRVLFCGAGPETSTVIAIQTTPKTNIKTVTDLKGRLIYAENPALVFFGPIMETILKSYGMTKADVKWQIFNLADDAYRDLKEGRIEALFYVTGTGTTDIAQSVGLFVVPISAAAQKAVEDTGIGYYGFTWPKGLFGNTIDTPALASPNLVWASTALSDDAAYAYVKGVFENLPELQKSQVAAEGFTKENALVQWTYAYHPGAIKYFKEIGVWKPEMDKKQADLIAKWSAAK